MPYIKPENRKIVDSEIEALARKLSDFPEREQDGVMNYAITRLCKKVYAEPKKSYFRFNRLMGMMSSCASEMYRRWIAPYEDEKKEANGDVI